MNKIIIFIITLSSLLSCVKATSFSSGFTNGFIINKLFEEKNQNKNKNDKVLDLSYCESIKVIPFGYPKCYIAPEKIVKRKKKKNKNLILVLIKCAFFSYIYSKTSEHVRDYTLGFYIGLTI